MGMLSKRGNCAGVFWDRGAAGAARKVGKWSRLACLAARDVKRLQAAACDACDQLGCQTGAQTMAELHKLRGKDAPASELRTDSSETTETGG